LPKINHHLLKQITACIFLLAFAWQTFSKAFMVVDYFANTAAFAKNCENKKRPQLHCNGQCQLMKKLQKEEKKDQQNPERKAENKNEVISTKSYFATATNPELIAQESITHLLFSDNREIKISYSIFHPPSA
jgi:hypothetical protein